MNMTVPNTEDEARSAAIDWQHWASEQNLGYGELAEWQNHFERVARTFGLTDEFRENGII